MGSMKKVSFINIVCERAGWKVREFPGGQKGQSREISAPVRDFSLKCLLTSGVQSVGFHRPHMTRWETKPGT